MINVLHVHKEMKAQVSSVKITDKSTASETQKEKNELALADNGSLKRCQSVVNFDFDNGEPKKKLKFDAYISELPEKEEEGDEAEEEEEETDSSSVSESDDSSGAKEKVIKKGENFTPFRTKESLTPEEKLNCTFCYGISPKDKELYRYMRSPLGDIIQGTYHSMKGTHPDAVSKVYQGEDSKGKYELRRSLFNGAYINHTKVYL